LLALFEKFTEDKFDIYFNEKNEIRRALPKMAADYRRSCILMHMTATLMSSFSSNEVRGLLGVGYTKTAG
jgi:hypothetical protein